MRLERAPGPRSLPVLGGMLQLREDPLSRVVALRARYGGVVRLGPLGRRELYLVSDPAAIRHVLLDNYKNYKKGLNARRLRPILGSGSLLLEGETWRRRRKLVQPAFHRQKIASLATAFVEATDQMLARWQTGETLDAREETLRLTMTLTLRNLFDADASTLPELVAAWQTLYASLGKRRLPFLRRDVDVALATVHRILDARIAATTPEHDTVLAMLVAARDEAGALTETELRDEVMTLFIGGYETSSNALAFSLANIAAHPMLADRQYAEIARVLGDRAPAMEDLSALPYTRAILDETLRLFPPSWMITREAIDDDAVAGFTIRGGSQLLISSYAVHHAPELWPDPSRFDPERFLDAPERSRFAYFPFGGGPRICLGDQYALTEMHLVLARIMQRFVVALAPGVRIGPRAHMGLRPAEPLRLVVRRRV